MATAAGGMRDGLGPAPWIVALVLALAAHGILAALLVTRSFAPGPVYAPPSPIMIDLPASVASAASVASEAVRSEADAGPVQPADLPPAETREEPPPEAEPVEPDRPAEPAPAEPPAETIPLPEPPTEAQEKPPEPPRPADPAPAAEIPPDPIPTSPDPEALSAAPPRASAPPKPAPKPTVRKVVPQKPARKLDRPTPPKPAPDRPAPRPPSPTTADGKGAAAPQARASAASEAKPAGSFDPSELGRYIAQLRNALERQKRYPAAARAGRAEGKAMVRFTVSRSGAVLAAALAKSSGHAVLDEAALAMVRQAAFPAAPPSLPQASFTVTAPIGFALD